MNSDVADRVYYLGLLTGGIVSMVQLSIFELILISLLVSYKGQTEYVKRMLGGEYVYRLE